METVGTLAAVAPNPSAQHPLEGLGLSTQNADVTGILETLGNMPGAAEANAAVQVRTDQQFADTERQQSTPQIIRDTRPPSATAQGLVQQQQQGQRPVDPAQAFNEQFKTIEETVKPPEEVSDDNVAMSRDNYDFLVGLISDQGAAIQAYVSGQTPVPGPSSIPVNTIVTPGYEPTPPQTGPQIAPLAVPDLELKEITETEFEKMTTDRAAMAKFLHERDKNVAATVTQQLAATVLPTVFSHINKQMESQRAIDGFLKSNPDLAANPQALNVAVQEARNQLPYANVDRLLYYAAQRLRSTKGVNDAINTSVHDHRGAVRGRRAPVIDNQRVDRAGGQNLAQVNPFDIMKDDMLRRAQPGQGDILRDLGIA